MIRQFENRRQCFLVLVGFLVWALIVFVPDVISQKNAESVLVHKYTEHFCEYGRSSIDLLLRDLGGAADLKGVIVLHPSVSDPLWPYEERETITNHLKFRTFDVNRIVFVIGDAEIRTSTELWKVPNNGLERFQGKAWDLSISAPQQPFMVHSKRWVDGIGCGLFTFRHQFFADVLQRNENIVGRVVIRETSNARFERTRRRISSELVEKFKVARKRLEFAFLQDKIVDVEYWLLPSDYFGTSTEY